MYVYRMKCVSQLNSYQRENVYRQNIRRLPPKPVTVTFGEMNKDLSKLHEIAWSLRVVYNRMDHTLKSLLDKFSLHLS